MKSRQMRIRAALALAAAVVLTVAAFITSAPAGAADPTDSALAHAQAQLVWCQQARAQAHTTAERAWGNTCITLAQRVLDSLTPPTTTPAPTTATSPPATTRPPTTTPPATTVMPPTSPPPAGCSRTGHVPGGPDGFGGCWPDATTTGVPAGTTLTAYTGPCVITSPVTITAKTVSCTLDIRSTGVQITNARIVGTVYVDHPGAGFVTILDSEIDAGGPTNSGLGKSDFYAARVHIHGGNRSAWCEYNCTIVDSYVHGQARDPSGVAHEGGIRMGDGSTIRHNAIACDAPDVPPDAGCSADLTGYGDFAPIRNNLLERNLFMASTGGACAYGGSSGDDGSKPFGNQAANIRFVDNVFQHGPGGKCGFYFPITDFDSSRPGNVWTGNVWDTGGTVPPAN